MPTKSISMRNEGSMKLWVRRDSNQNTSLSPYTHSPIQNDNFVETAKLPSQILCYFDQIAIRRSICNHGRVDGVTFRSISWLSGLQEHMDLRRLGMHGNEWETFKC